MVPKKSNNKKVFLQIQDVSKQFPSNDYKTVDNISLEIYEGESFSLLGPSGCGKTTLMRMIAGFEMPDSGKIIMDGKDITKMPPHLRPFNMMFQSYALFPHMNVRKNIEFGLKQEKLPKDEIQKRVEEVLLMVGLNDLAHRMPNQLSGGQQQRTALARSLVKRPKILLLDEPLGALDRKTREKTQVELINIQNLLDITFIIVTHDQEEAMSMSDRLAVMKQGKLCQIGTPKKIYEYPNSRFVADFVGSINLFQGYITDTYEPDYTEVYSKEYGGTIIIRGEKQFPKNTEVWVAVRPEEMTIGATNLKEDENQVEGKIIDIAFLGGQIIYHMLLDSGKIVQVAVPTSARSKNPNLDFGNRAIVSWHDTDGVVLTS